jgi:hypothetical protein
VSKKTKLNQIIAIEKGVKTRTYAKLSRMHKDSQKAEPFNGFAKTYRRRDEDGVDYPSERKKVQLNAEALLKDVANLQTETFDVTATKDWGNCGARADVTVDGRVLVKDAPVTWLLFLEKQLSDLRTFVDKLPTLDEAEDWARDPNGFLFKTEKITTHKTKKVQRPIVLYDATEEHPAQTQLITEDVVVGWWDTVKHSGAIPIPRKQAILDRIVKLTKAVKQAREEANGLEIEPVEVGGEIFRYLFE